MLQRDKVFGRNMRSHPADVISPRSVMTALMAAVLVLGGCRDSFMKQATADKTSAIASLSATVDEAGNITADFDPNSGQTQVLKLASGALAGSAVAIPPGSLAIPVSITVGEGETLASSSFTQQIGLTDNSVTAAGPSVSFIPSTNVQASSPFTLSLPFSLTSLALAAIDTENVIVMFRSIKVDGDQTSYEMGVIPRSEVTVSADKVSFQTKQFGVFQLAKTEKKITQRVKQPTIEVPVMKKEAGNPLLGAWESCRADNAGTGNIEPLTWLRANSSGYYNASQQWVSKVSLSWSGGSAPFKITRYTGKDCLGTGSDLSNITDNKTEDSNLPVARMLYYKILDSQNNSSKCQPVQVITEPEKIRWSAVEYAAGTVATVATVATAGTVATAPTATASWLGAGQSFIISKYTQYACQGNATTVTPTSQNYTFTIPTAGGFSVKLSNSDQTVTSSCLDLKTDQAFLPSIGGTGGQTAGIRMINSVEITSPSAEGGDSKIVVKFTAASQASYTAKRSSAPGCLASSSVKNIIPNTNGTVGTFQDLVKATDLGANQSPSYLLVQSVQSGTTSLSQCVNFLPIDNRISALRIYNVSVNPTSVEFNWIPDGVIPSNVKLYKHEGINCSNTGTEVSLIPPSDFALSASQKIASLAKITDYSFKLKTTDSSVPEVCFNARTTDGDPPFRMPQDATTVAFEAETNVTDGKSHKILLKGMASQQTEKYSLTFHQTSSYSERSITVDQNLMGQDMNLVAPNGCQFVMGSSQFTQISLTESNTVYDSGTNVARVLTDGLLVQCNGTGGDENQNEGPEIDALGSVPERTYSRLNKLKIGKDAFIMRQDVFTSKDCMGYPVSSNTEQGVFVLPAVDVEGTIPIDVTQMDLNGAIFTIEGVDVANKAPDQFGCGLSGWVKGKVQNLAKSKCGEVGKTHYERLKVKGGRLYMCSSGQNKEYGNTSEMRIRSCDITSDMEYFIRQK